MGMLSEEALVAIKKTINFRYDEHIGVLLAIPKKHLSKIVPNRGLPISEILEGFNSDTNNVLLEYGETLRREIIHALEKLKLQNFSEEDKMKIMDLVDNFCKAELYEKRFDLMLDAIERKLKGYGISFDRSKYRIDIPRSLCKVSANNTIRIIKSRLENDLSYLVESYKSQEDESNNKLKLLKQFGVIIALVAAITGIFTGGLGLYDRLSRPKIEVLGIAPIVVWQRPQDDIENTFYGISIIIKVKNIGTKQNCILGADLSGKIYLSYDEFWPIYRQNNPKSSPDEIKTKFNKLKPYRNISWVGWLTDHKDLLRVDPGKERFVKVTFSEPFLSFAVSMHSGNILDEIGYEKTMEQPKIINHSPAIQWFMKDNSLRDEYMNNLVKITVKLGNESMYVDQDKIVDLKIVTKAAWDEYDARKIYYDLN